MEINRADDVIVNWFMVYGATAKENSSWHETVSQVFSSTVDSRFRLILRGRSLVGISEWGLIRGHSFLIFIHRSHTDHHAKI